MAAVALFVMLVFAAWELFDWPPGHRTLIGDLFAFPPDLIAIGAAWAASRRCSARPRLRSAWRLIALSWACLLLGDIAWGVYELVGASPYPSVADVLYLMFYPLMLWGLLRFPADRDQRGRLRLLLDLATVAVGGAVVVIYVVLGPTILSSGSEPLATAISIAYPVGDMILLVGLGSMLLRRAAPSSVPALRFMAAGVLFYVVADLLYSYITFHSGYNTGDPVDSLWMVAILLFAVAGAAQNPPEHGGEIALGQIPKRVSWTPYIAVAVGFALLLFSRRKDPVMPDLVLVFSAMVLAALVSSRQLLAQRDLLRTQGQLSFQSLHDSLTGLPNRALVLDRAEQMLARARRNQLPIAALYVDVDAFKHVNDAFGHAAGDELLQTIAARLSSTLREADTVGRLGGDEFIVLCENSTLDAGPELVAERISEVLRQPIELESASGRTLSVTASIGIALGQRTSAEELFRDADLALYEAKGAGKNRWVVFESRMHTASQDRLALEMDLKQALSEDQLFLLYQPTFNLESETITGLEALLRWRHPTRGVIAPDAFIPIAEETGLIVPIGRWVLKTACKRAASWHRQAREIGMSINVSARQLDDDDLIADVTETLRATGLDPRLLTLEITETTLMRDAGDAARRLAELKHVGVRIAIDDFGTGYSSLGYLRQFPIDAIKIDRSFISGIAASKESKALLHTLVQLGKTLGLETLGEGIEERAQLLLLQREHCDFGQGFLFARPLEPTAIDALLELTASSSTAQA